MTASGAIPHEGATSQTGAGDTGQTEGFAVDLFLCGAALVALSLPTLTRPRPQEATPRVDPEALSRWEDEGGTPVPPPAPEDHGKPGWASVGLAIGIGAGAAAALPMSGVERRAIRRTGTAAGRILRHQVVRELSWARRVAADVALGCLDAVDDAMNLLERRVTRTAEHAADEVAARLTPRKR